ncbi:putative F-box domain-containing protein [Rosa chinensis]|uniref:Putative F-box domain-containing protein n=1 Tax=Rosa chinensis TaxID=74649 RepID=A0A2P6RL55_ROSCH|nr:F-box/kelch-repeat protein At3g06240 [Rosa chinensis]XP_040370013.1 F-box/kelch-repeat protein At3g06240 [Rosa chinensis]PRQ47170.1 putative F-box domain-containing protein [Rosa chinensis]
MARTCSQDVLSDILCRLHVKSLKRFQCVCKSWYALIRHPSFVTKHLHFHSRQNKITRSFLLSHSLDQRYSNELPIDQRKDTCFSLVNLDETAGGIVSLDWLKFSDISDQGNKFPNYWYGDVEISGPRNGIYCLHEASQDHSDVIALVNISLREFKLVPKPEQSIIWHPGYFALDWVEIGFDPKTNDYKVFFFKELCSTDTQESERQAAIYHLSSNSWKKLSAPLLEHVILYFRDCNITDTYVNGRVHWLGFEDYPGRRDWCILSFDMVREVFAKIKLPDLSINWDETEYLLAVFNESLSLILYPKTPDYPMFTGYIKCFDIWVMNDYGNDRSWTKLFTTGPVASAYRLLGFWRNGDFLIQHDFGYTISYDPGTQEIEPVCFGEGLHLNQSRIYSESLVSVTGNARNDFEIVVEDFPFVMTPDMKRVLDYIEKCPSCSRLTSD